MTKESQSPERRNVQTLRMNVFQLPSFSGLGPHLLQVLEDVSTTHHILEIAQQKTSPERKKERGRTPNDHSESSARLPIHGNSLLCWWFGEWVNQLTSSRSTVNQSTVILWFVDSINQCLARKQPDVLSCWLHRTKENHMGLETNKSRANFFMC